MDLFRTAQKTYELSEGEYSLEFTQSQYEDIYYAMPIDTGSLYLLVHETLLETPQERTVLRKIIELNGGIEGGLNRLQELARDVDPTIAVIEQIRPEITVEWLENDKKYRIACDELEIKLPAGQYRDLFDSVPNENAALFRFINDTLLHRPASRETFRKMVDRAGGMDVALEDFQERVQALPPIEVPSPAKAPPAKAAVPMVVPEKEAPAPFVPAPVPHAVSVPVVPVAMPPAKEAPPPKAEPVPPPLFEPIEVAPVPDAEPVREVAVPTAEPVKVAPVPKAEPVKEVAPPKVQPMKAAPVPKAEPVKEIPSPKAEPVKKAQAAAATTASPAVLPKAVPVVEPKVAPVPAGTPAWPAKPVAPVPPATKTPVAAPVVKPPPAKAESAAPEAAPAPPKAQPLQGAEGPPKRQAPAAAPVVPKPAAAKTAAPARSPAGTPALTAAAPAAPAPAAAAKPATKPAAQAAAPAERPSAPFIPKPKRAKGEGPVTLDRGGDGSIVINAAGYTIDLAAEQYKEFWDSNADTVMKMFKTLHNQILQQNADRGMLMKMISLVGGPKEFMDAFRDEVAHLGPPAGG